MNKTERHGEFIARLGDRLFLKYTDGGPKIIPPEPPQEKRSKEGKGGRFARSVRRNSTRRPK